MTTPPWLRKAAIASVLADLLTDPELYLTREFGLQRRADHVVDLADRLYEIATEEE